MINPQFFVIYQQSLVKNYDIFQLKEKMKQLAKYLAVVNLEVISHLQPLP